MMSSQLKRTAFKVGGMHCAGCANSISHFVENLQGVKKCEVNLASEKATVEFDDSVDVSQIEKAIRQAGYQVVYEKLVIKIEGISDSADALGLEKKLQIEGVKSASVNYGTGQATILYNPALLSLSDIKHTVAAQGYTVVSEELAETAEELEAKKVKKLLLAGIIFTIPVLVFGYPEYLPFVPFAATNISAFLIFVCASVVQFVTGSRFYAGAYRITKMRSANMDTLVVLGTTSAYLFSAYNTFPSPVWHNMYYDASSVVIVFVLAGKYLENKTKGKTSRIIKKMLELQPKTARIIKNGIEIETPIEQIKAGDIILVKPGERIPSDSIVLQGHSAVDESAITGESIPVEKKQGDSVIGGTVNKEGVLKLRAHKVGSQTVLWQIVRMVEDAMGQKPPLQKLVDKISGYFAFFVVISAAITFFVWFFFTDFGAHHFAASLIPAVAILVVACPCALGLATPTALMVGMSKAAQNGVLFKNGEALETLGKIKIIIFDKTGTLTEARPQVTEIIPYNEKQDLILRLAAVAEKNSEHPLARGIVNKAIQNNLQVGQPDEFSLAAGRGVIATYENSKIIVGNLGFVEENGVKVKLREQISELQQQGKTAVIVAINGEFAGVIGMIDAPRKEAKNTIQKLREAGLQVVMLSGDNQNTANTIARQLGISRVVAGVLPHQKVDVVKQLQKEAKIAMVGDGINDAAALTQADVGIAIGSGTDIAIEAGNVVLVQDNLEDVLSAITISKKTISKIKQNLFYAFAYNVVLIPVAAMGLLYPTLAGMAMAASSVSVTASSLLLKRWNPKKNS